MRSGDLSPQPQLGNPAVASASLVAGASPRGSYSLEVLELASAQSLSSPAYSAASDQVGSGTLTLRFGSVVGATFSADGSRAAVDIAIPTGTTLVGVAAAINGSGAGVTAYVAQATDGARLVLKGADGATNGFVLEAVETPGEEGLANLAWEPANGAPTRLLSAANDARFKLDGLEMTSPTNAVTQPAPGFNLTLRVTNEGAPTQLSFGNPATAISSFMQDFTGALNEVASALNAATDPNGGDLARDPGARALRQALGRLAGSVVMPDAPGDAPRTLADLGLATNRDGTFRLDPARLAATLQRDPEAVAAMFTTGLYGVYATIDGLSRRATSLTNPGSLGGSISRYTDQKAKAAEDLAKIAEKQEVLRASLVQRFAVTDARVGASKATLSFLQNQIDAWNAPRN
jgi:flagellar hook-associated protein 2